LNISDIGQQEATDENMERYLSLLNLELNHMVKRGWKRIVSEDKLREIAYNARNDLKTELLRLPTINEVDQRVAIYLAPLKGQFITREINKAALFGAIVGIITLILLFLILYWAIRTSPIFS
jgi:tetrahydromethanopterin S-methyltransferase subunit G